MCPLRTMNNQVLNFLLVGDDDTGKFEIMNSFPNQADNEAMIRHFDVTYRTTNIILPGEKVKVHIWESGHTMFPYVYTSYARSVDGIILVYDLLNKFSFKYLPFWIQVIREMAPTVPVILVASNKHLEINRTVKEKKARAFAKKQGMDYLEISGFCNYRVDEALSLLARKALLKSAVQRFWTQSKISTLEDLCLRKVITCLKPDTDIDKLPITRPMKDNLRLHIPKNIYESPERRFKLNRIGKMFRKKEKSTANSVQLPHDRIKPSRAYHHFVSRNWLKLPSCLHL